MQETTEAFVIELLWVKHIFYVDPEAWRLLPASKQLETNFLGAWKLSSIPASATP